MQKTDEAYRRLYLELEAYERHGVRIRMNRKPASPCQIADAFALREGVAYMRDYVLEGGHLTELHFDQVGATC
jgi:hypothetical protein